MPTKNDDVICNLGTSYKELRYWLFVQNSKMSERKNLYFILKLSGR